MMWTSGANGIRIYTKNIQTEIIWQKIELLTQNAVATYQKKKHLGSETSGKEDGQRIQHHKV